MATIAQHIATAEQGLGLGGGLPTGLEFDGTPASSEQQGREFFARYINVSIRSSRSTRAINKYIAAAQKHGFAITWVCSPDGSSVIEVVDEVNK